MLSNRKIVVNNSRLVADDSAECYYVIRLTIGEFPNDLHIEIPHYVDCSDDCECLSDIVNTEDEKYYISAEMVDNEEEYDPELLNLTAGEYEKLITISEKFREAIVSKNSNEFVEYCDSLW